MRLAAQASPLPSPPRAVLPDSEQSSMFLPNCGWEPKSPADLPGTTVTGDAWYCLGRVWDLPNGWGDLISMMETEVHIRPVLPAWRLLHTYTLMQVPGYPPKTKTMSSWSKPPAEANIGAPAMSPYPIMSPNASVHTVDAHPSRQTYLCSRHRISPWSDLLFFFV
ncbi:hypothetical protein QC761_001075 [Podospora bellae-mahoneyi]|uniref:Uncharacterized protein n=1 Tax=Podospora bellae-mahoneyi TaxID=2093777 RepID=A0ABR0FNC3_9PEZI|nr:hypothetical protein QC761_001075 [Podospora bellae-mahoneyi]